ncbi:unnamed protein product [Cylicocyclus nassatus]|uniref:Uncharacterized protein n=1 Tax=Cylicocyclus nassatus TaxID=53992 RepID=A0AA36DVN4_CYLNA|nr:unnamed protein product [Cylicocyclus nassatus]
MLYLEMLMGQYSNEGPTTLFAHYVPAFQGLGWAMALICFTVAIYYCVVVAWCFLYFFAIISGETVVWSRCDNVWNDVYCIETEAMKKCKQRDPSKPIAFNGSCIASAIEGLKTPYDQYFTNVMTKRSSGIEHYGGINWSTLLALAIIWIFVGLILLKGYVYLGKAAYVFSVAPFAIVFVVFWRAITLDGAIFGVYYYFGTPDFYTLLHHETWTEALMQVCFNLNVGYGGIIVVASYNRRKNNCYKDAWVVVIATFVMNIFGGVVVFASLGYISKQLNKPINGIVSSGLSIAFVAYLEAMQAMPYSSVWSMFFFAMLFLLGFGSVMVSAETICTCIYDEWPSTRSFKWVIAFFCSAIHLFFGIIMTTESGFYWFTLLDEFSGSTSLCLIVSMEAFMLMHIFGHVHVYEIINEIFGERSGSILSMLGPHSRLWEICWKFFIPAMGLMHVLFTVIRKDPKVEDYMRREDFPLWALAVGRCLRLLPLLPVLVFFIVNVIRWRRKKMSLKTLFFQPVQTPRDSRSDQKDISSNKSGESGRLPP